MERNLLQFPFQPEAEPKKGLGRIFERAKIYDEQMIGALVDKVLKDKDKIFNPARWDLLSGNQLRVNYGPLQLTLHRNSMMDDHNRVVATYSVWVDIKGMPPELNLTLFFSLPPGIYEKDIEKIMRDGLAMYNYWLTMKKKYPKGN